MRYQKVKDYLTQQDSTIVIKQIGDDGVEWFVPMEESNSHYQKYLQWLQKGNTPEEAE
jgi:hypothetical protein